LENQHVFAVDGEQKASLSLMSHEKIARHHRGAFFIWQTKHLFRVLYAARVPAEETRTSDNKRPFTVLASGCTDTSIYAYAAASKSTSVIYVLASYATSARSTEQHHTSTMTLQNARIKNAGIARAFVGSYWPLVQKMFGIIHVCKA